MTGHLLQPIWWVARFCKLSAKFGHESVGSPISLILSDSGFSINEKPRIQAEISFDEGYNGIDLFKRPSTGSRPQQSSTRRDLDQIELTLALWRHYVCHGHFHDGCESSL